MATKFADMTHEGRNDPRHDVHHRLRLKDQQGRTHMLTIVNISAQGIMARCDHDFAVGNRFQLSLPVAGSFIAEVRWALGGRIGCRLDTAIPVNALYAMLATMTDVI